jgi:hypothetical protein
MTSPCLPDTGSLDSSPLAPGSLTPSHPGSSLELRPLSCTLVEPVRQDVEAHRALSRSAVLLSVAVPVFVPAPAVVPVPAFAAVLLPAVVLVPAVVPVPAVLLPVAVAVRVPPGLLLSVHVDDVYLAHVRMLSVAHARETSEQIKVKPQSSYEYPYTAMSEIGRNRLML